MFFLKCAFRVNGVYFACTGNCSEKPRMLLVDFAVGERGLLIALSRLKLEKTELWFHDVKCLLTTSILL